MRVKRFHSFPSSIMRTKNKTSSAMRLYGKAESAATQILAVFRQPELLPAALAPIFIRRKDNVPCRSWSWLNQLLVALHGHSDARGFRQWEQVGRHVKKGERSFPILAPVIRKIADDEETEEERVRVVGFKSTPVFGYLQTQGQPLPEPDRDLENWLASLPLAEVASAWNISVAAYNGRPLAAAGRYSHDGHIALGVKNLSTWCHEMIHAADDRNDSLIETGQHWRSETVAELGGAVLLKILSYETDADLGGCWEYICTYAERAGIQPITACQRVLTRTCDAVALILDTAEQLAAPKAACEKPCPTWISYGNCPTWPDG
jgi:hypothetical protein